jgi:hypothetical protein
LPDLLVGADQMLHVVPGARGQSYAAANRRAPEPFRQLSEEAEVEVAPSIAGAVERFRGGLRQPQAESDGL